MQHILQKLGLCLLWKGSNRWKTVPSIKKSEHETNVSLYQEINEDDRWLLGKN